MIRFPAEQNRTEVQAQHSMQLRDCRVGQRVIHETLGPGEVVDVKSRTVIVRLDHWPQLFALPSELREESPRTSRDGPSIPRQMQ